MYIYIIISYVIALAQVLANKQKSKFKTEN